MFYFIISLAVILWIWAAWIEPRWLRIRRVALKFHKSTLSGCVRILHISDTHFAGPEALQSAFFDKLAQEHVDFVFYTGDIMDHPRGIPSVIQNIRKLKPRYGIYAVLGNHDYYNYRFLDVLVRRTAIPKQTFDDSKLVQALEAEGVHVLKNESICLSTENGLIWVHGLDDPWSQRADPSKIEPALKKEGLHFLLTHSVDVLRDFNPERLEAVFSGHSHGGQIRFPFLGPVVTHTELGKGYVDGIKEYKGTVCLISRGMNAGRNFRLRFRCRPEVFILEASGR